jgi:inhibitor of the pro-sigma K processing machinery
VNLFICIFSVGKYYIILKVLKALPVKVHGGGKMGFTIDWPVILAYGIGILMLYLLAKLLFVPLKILWRLVYNALIGGVMLWVLNLVGGYFGLHVPINAITALIAGFLGIPGVILLIILQYLMK